MNARRLWIAVVVGVTVALTAYPFAARRDASSATELPRGIASAIPASPFQTSEDCFARWPTYESWLVHLKSTLPWWSPRRALLKSRFPKIQFEHVRDSMACRAISYRNDGFTITGWMLTPKTPAGNRLPVIVYNRGGNGRFGAITLATVLHDLAPLADQGFIVLASQYRGATESDPRLYGQDQFGGDDVRDVTKLVELAGQLPDADARNVFMVGASRGAMMTFLALRQGAAVRAAAVIAGVSDLAEDLGKNPRMDAVYRQRIPGYPTGKDQALADRSVVKWARDLPRSVPVLVLHGDNDQRVDVRQAHLLRSRLQAIGQPHRLIIYQGGDHRLAKHRLEAAREIGAWFRSSMIRGARRPEQLPAAGVTEP